MGNGGDQDLTATPIYSMYVAGRETIPAQAKSVSKVAQGLDDALTTLNVQTALAGDPDAMTSLLKVGADVYEVLGDVEKSLNNCADAVMATARDFVNHDRTAAGDLRGLETSDDRKIKTLMSETTKHYAAPTPLPDVGAPGAPDPNPPTRIGRGDFTPHDDTMPATPAPVTPGTDESQRDKTESQDKKDNPTLYPGSGG